ncbi:hypothetical protein V8F20_004071 [Naviculisporaceae sp. PSN 640]
MAVNIATPIPVSPGAAKRFYEAVILLYCIIDVNLKNNTITEPDLDTATGKSAKDEFFCFVNKLGQICDSDCGGETITAFAVLQPGTIQYRFASNNRTQKELDLVKRYITDVLGFLGQTPDDKLDSIRDDLLRKILLFTRPRIEHHITQLLKELDFCIEVCKIEDTNAVGTAAINLLKTISTLYSTPFETFTRQKSRLDSDPNNRTPWSELRHHLGRLQSYSIAVTVLISIRRHRPALFEDFTVVAVPSIRPMEDTPNIRRSADGIVKRMPSNIQTAYRPCSSYLGSLGLDETIKKAAKPGNFKPIVHCEVNLFDSILRENQSSEDDLPFYGEATWGRYIGCSKPTCRLCALYFAGHPTQVKVRASHGNVYYKWRVPDIFEGEGERIDGEQKARKQRDDILEGMIKQVRNGLLEVLGGMVNRKKHDSLTTPSNPYPTVFGAGLGKRSGYGGEEGSALGDVDAEDLAERLGDMRI